MSSVNRIGVSTYNPTLQTVSKGAGSGKFASFMSSAAKALGAAGSVAAPFIPGGSIVKAAVFGASAYAGAQNPNDFSSAADMKATGDTGPGAGDFGWETGGGETSIQDGMSMADCLAMQMRVQKEVVMFSTISNVSKARHDAAMTAVRNIK